MLLFFYFLQLSLQEKKICFYLNSGFDNKLFQIFIIWILLPDEGLEGPSFLIARSVSYFENLE